MYAVIRAGGKQHKVEQGDIIEVEKIKGSGDSVEYTPLLVVDDKGKVTSARSELAGATVTAKVLGETQGTKIEVYKYRNKTGYRRHSGHRQSYSQVEVSAISLTDKAKTAKTTKTKTTKAKTTKAKTMKEEEATDGS